MKNMKFSLLAFFACFFIQLSTIQATTIIPYPNLGEMAVHSEAVVLARAVRNYSIDDDGMTRFRTDLLVLHAVKGNLKRGDGFVIQDNHNIIGEVETTAWGDLEMEEGEVYFLFLDKLQERIWIPKMMSYAAFQQAINGDNNVLLPMGLGNEVHIAARPDGRSVESLKMYKTKELIKMLAGIVGESETWNASSVEADPSVQSLFAEQRGTPPAHCSLLAGQARWELFPTALPVYTSAVDTGCATAIGVVNASIGAITGSYAGVTLANGGIHGFVPDCSSGVNGTEFFNWVNANYGGNSITVSFNDPCEQIPDLVNCSGVLGRGGLYTFSSTHTFNNMTWNDATHGYVYVNNATGTCLCNTGYFEMMTHELTHSLNVGHIPTASGTANMNPSCCEGISQLDIDCLDFMYVAAPLPVEMLDFTGERQQKTIALDWLTASEYNNDYFVIERSINGKNYEAIGQVSGAGEAKEESAYQFIDKSPFNGVNYYRLSQIDYNGAQSDYEQLAVNFFEGLKVNITPNPYSSGALQTTIAAASRGELNVNVFDLLGRPVYQQQSRIDKGNNQLSLPLNELSKGMYIIQFEQGQLTETVRFVKSE